MPDCHFLVENTHIGMFIYQEDRFTFANHAFARTLGYPDAKTFLDKGITLRELFPLDLSNDCKQTVEYHNEQDGQTRHLEIYLTRHAVEGTNIWCGTAVDITDFVRITNELSISEQKYRSLFEYNSNVIYSFDTEGRFQSVNPAATELTGYSHEELINKNVLSIIHPDDAVTALHNFVKVNEQKHKTRQYELRVIHKSGEIRYIQALNIPIIVNDKLVGVYGIAQDITEQKKYLQKIEHLAYYDHLTNLPNRRHFEERLRELYLDKKPRALAIVDVDDFKVINDTMGHEVGDDLLKEFAELLLDVTKGTDIIVARLGGDEFALLQPSDKIKPLLRIARELLARLQEPLVVKDFELFISASIGISSTYGKELTPQQLFRNADIALYSTKKAGKRNVSVYNSSEDRQTLIRFTLVRDMKGALADGQFYLEYLPKYSLLENRVSGVEALLRWQHPYWGRVLPSEFISIAEETGLINDLGKWAIQTACREMKPVLEKYDLNLSVNVSVVQIMNRTFINDLTDILEKERFDPRRLEIEITESVLKHSERMMNYFLERIRSLGIRVALDDFGAGYSSLSFLQKYEIDSVKLDKSFVESDHERRNRIIFSGVVKLLRDLRMQVVAEGIETREQLDYVMQMNCDEAQGYLISRPLRFYQVSDMIEASAAKLG